jgi:hypothetical protein
MAEQRRVRLRPRNDSRIEFKRLHLRTGWSGQEVSDDCWKLQGTLPRSPCLLAGQSRTAIAAYRIRSNATLGYDNLSFRFAAVPARAE